MLGALHWPPLHLGRLPLRAGPPLCAVSAPPRPWAPQPVLPALTCGLQASWLCNRPGPGRTQALLCLRCLCPPRVPEVLPGPEWRAALGLQVGPCCSIPHLWTGSQGAVPWVHRACGQGVCRSASCPEELLAWGWGRRQGLSGPRRADARLSLGLGPTGQAAWPRCSTGTEPGEALCTRDPPPVTGFSTKKYRMPEGLHFRYNVS